MYRMFERPNLCPYTDICDSFQTIRRAESWTEKALAKLMREGGQDIPSLDDGYSTHTLRWRLEHMRQVKERCYSHCGRCLRFRQFKAREEDEPAFRRRGLAWPSEMRDEEAVVEPSSSGRS